MNDEILVEETEEVFEDFNANLHPYDLPGEWFVLNAQSGHEKKVRTNILTRIKNLHIDDKVYDVVIPTDEVIEIRNGKHLCQIECAKDFNKTIKLFIDKDYDEA